jgi:Lipocalin-like domain
MKKLPFLPIVLFAITAVISISCKKDKDKGPSCATDVASISGAYKFAAYTYKQTPTSPEEDWLPVVFPDACQRDDVLSFNANGNYAIADAGTVCSPSGGDSGTWSLSGSTMNIDGDAAAIESFDCKTLVLVNNDVNVPGDKLKITLTRQ